MSAKGVLVTSYDQSGKVVSRSSAVSFGDLILLHGDHLVPLLEQKKWKELFKSILPSVFHNTAARDFIATNIRFEISEEEENENFLPDTVERVGRKVVTAAVWKCSLVEKSLEMFRSAFDNSLFPCLSLFVLLKIPGDNGVSLRQRIFQLIHTVKTPVRGENVVIESTPGAMEVLINSWSRGVIARVYGRHGCMFLTDAIVHTDCTGAPVYSAVYSRFDTMRKGLLLGVVLGRIGELNEFTCGIALMPVLGDIVPIARIHPRVIPRRNEIRLVDKTLVMVSSGNQHGSGVVVDACHGVVLTCSHVIENVSEIVKIFHKGNVFVGDVVFSSRECDLAVLKAPRNSFHEHMAMADSSARRGDSVYLAGFPQVLPFEEHDIRPFINVGCVSKSLPFAIVINCSVSKGISGGAVIRNEKLLGLISFTTTGQSGFAFAVPITVFQDHIRKYIETNDVTQLSNLKSADANVIRFWNPDNCKL